MELEMLEDLASQILQIKHTLFQAFILDSFCGEGEVHSSAFKSSPFFRTENNVLIIIRVMVVSCGPNWDQA